MDTDDLGPIPTKGVKADLDDMSIEAIGEYIDSLKAEIARAESAIESKKAARAGAEAVFKT